MLNKIKDFFSEELNHTDDEQLSANQCQLASAALLIEVATADSDFDAQEVETLKSVLTRTFGLQAAQLEELTALAEAEKEQATSLYQFTQLINDGCSMTDKYRLMTAMWEVAYADGNLDKYEEHLIRRVADLIYVPHSDFIRAKLEARSGD